MAGGCGFSSPVNPSGRTLFTTSARLKTLDPALAADAASSTAVGHLYDRLLEYEYLARPYRLRPSMGVAMPTVTEEGRVYTFTLRQDLYFAPDPCFPAGSEGNPRRVTARDVVFSLLRIADGRVHSSGYWIFRDCLVGVDAFHAQTVQSAEGDYSLYEHGIAGLSAPDDRTVVFRLHKPFPRLLNTLAMPYCSILPERAIRAYGMGLGEHPVGSGPFLLREWRRNYRIVFGRNPDYRPQLDEDGPRTLPNVDAVVCNVVQEPLTAWLLFLQGNLDMTQLSDDTFESVMSKDIELSPDLRDRGVHLHRTAEFQINYIAFNARDPLLGRNLKLRQAISLAYSVGTRVEMASRQLTPANGPIPPGVSGYDEGFTNPYATYDVGHAQELLREAGFPDGTDPGTGRPLTLHFDLGRTDLLGRQQAEMMVSDMRKLGIRIVPHLNSWPRFLEKINRGDTQLFRLAWIGDYPDGQNFLQLFYGPNAGSCNRAFYRNSEFDALYEQAVDLPESPERSALYGRMQRLVAEDCPWIFESYPVSFRLAQPWVAAYVPHHFACDVWKYLQVDPEARTRLKAGFRPLRLRRPASHEAATPDRS